MTELEEITGAHIVEWGGVDVFPPDDRMTGFAARSDTGALVAIAVAYLDDELIWRAAFARRPGCPAWVHDEVRQALRQVFDAGVNEIVADPDPTVRRSREYLSWLGFAPRGDESGDWVLWASSLKA